MDHLIRKLNIFHVGIKNRGLIIPNPEIYVQFVGTVIEHYPDLDELIPQTTHSFLLKSILTSFHLRFGLQNMLFLLT
jgi:hypothetical protein